MGIFDKIKSAVSNRIGDEVAKKIDPLAGSDNSGSSSSSYQPKVDAAHEARVEELRKQNEIRALENEAKMQDASMMFANRFMNAAAGSMEETNKMLEEQNKKNKE